MKQRQVVVVVALLSHGALAVAAVDCASLNNEATRAGVRIQGYESGRTVVGSGRAQFYTAPSQECAQPGVFVVPGDAVNAYIEQAGFTSVLFINLKTGGEAEGWVLSSRLQENGHGISPKQ